MVQIAHSIVKIVELSAPFGKGGSPLPCQPRGTSVQADQQRVAGRAGFKHVQLPLDFRIVRQGSVHLQKGGLRQAGQRFVRTLHHNVRARRHCAALPAQRFGKGQVVCAVGFVHQKRHAVRVADFGNRCNVRNHTLIRRACYHDTAYIFVLFQRRLHVGGLHAAVHAKGGVHRRQQVMRVQLPQFHRVIDRLVAVARQQNFAAEGCQRAHARQQSHGAAPHQVPAAAAAVQRGGALHRGCQNAVRVVQVVGAVNFGHIPRGAAQPGRGQNAALVSGHMQRRAGSG